MLYTLIVILLVGGLSYFIGSKTSHEDDYENIILFFIVVASSIAFSFILDFVIRIEFSSFSLIDLIINRMEEYKYIDDIYWLMENSYDSLVTIIRSFVKFISFTLFFATVYTFIAIKRIISTFKNIKNIDYPNTKNAFFYLIEGLVVFSIILSPVSLVVTYYNKLNNSFTNSDANVCEKIEDLQQYSSYCSLLDRLNKDILLKYNSNIFYNQLNTYLITDKVAQNLDYSLDELDSQLDLIYYSKVYKMITIENFSIKNIQDYEIDLDMIFLYIETIDEDKVPFYFLTAIMDVFNKVIEYFYNQNRSQYPSLTLEELKYDYSSFKNDFPKIKNLVSFIRQADLIDLMYVIEDGLNLSTISSAIEHLRDRGLLNFSTALNLSNNLEGIKFIDAMSDHIESKNFFTSFVGWFSKSIVSAMYVSMGLFNALDEFLSDFRQTELAQYIKKILLDLEDTRISQ